LAVGRDPPVCWCPPRCGAPLQPPRGVVCPPVVGACPVCCPPLRWVLAPFAGAPPRCCGPNRDHCYDRLVATAPHRIHSLARSMETPGERPPTRLRVVCQEGWDGARRHPQPAAGVQSAEQWCSSQSQPQPQLRYQHMRCCPRRPRRSRPSSQPRARRRLPLASTGARRRLPRPSRARARTPTALPSVSAPKTMPSCGG